MKKIQLNNGLEIEAMDRKESLILNITSLDEVYRLHNIRFEQ